MENGSPHLHTLPSDERFRELWSRKKNNNKKTFVTVDRPVDCCHGGELISGGGTCTGAHPLSNKVAMIANELGAFLHIFFVILFYFYNLHTTIRFRFIICSLARDRNFVACCLLYIFKMEKEWTVRSFGWKTQFMRSKSAKKRQRKREKCRWFSLFRLVWMARTRRGGRI